MAREIKVDLYAGSLVFWKASITSAEELRNVCELLGLSVSWYELIDSRALELALKDRFNRTGKLIRPTRPVQFDGHSCASFVVVSERQAEAANDYASEIKFFLHPTTYAVYLYDAAGNHAETDRVNAKKFQGMVEGKAVGIGLEAVVRVVGGYKLRDNARIYYVPQLRMDRWEEVSAEFEKLGMTFFRANCPADAATAAAVADNAVEELRERYRKALEEVAKCDSTIGDSATSEARIAKAEARRVELLRSLDAVKAEAAAIDLSFKGYLDLSAQITEEIDSEIAMAVLLTSI